MADTYAGKHKIPRRERGPARDYPCTDCGRTALHWSTIHGRTGDSASDYEPRCASCHAIYDQRGNGLGEQNSNVKLSRDQVLVIWSQKGSGSATAIAREHGIHVQNVYRIWSQRTWGWLTGSIGRDGPSSD